MDREALTFLATLDEHAERYDDMVDHITVVATSVDDELTVEERNLLAVAYKNVIGSRRASWRAISHLESNTKSDDDPTATHDIKAYRLKIERELELLCTDMLAIIDKHLLSKSSSGEGRVFYCKMKGDYHRYIAEFRFNEERAKSARNALEAYKEASVIAMTELAPTNPIRLGLALNFSVFYCDILNSLEQACGLAKRAFDDAIAELDTLTEDPSCDSTMIMQLLRRNLMLWTTEGEELQDKPKN